MKKILIILIILLLLVVIFWLMKPGITTNKDVSDSNSQEIQLTESSTPSITPVVTITSIDEAKIIPSDNLCPQISKEFVTKVTGITIDRVASLNGAFINACDYYLTDDKNAPYIAIIVNKNLNFEKHKQIAINNKFIVKTDPSILVNHFIAWADKETRISNINLFLDENSFLRIDKNVERAIDNDGMIKLASALSKRL